jgi:hypothetical protein
MVVVPLPVLFILIVPVRVAAEVAFTVPPCTVLLVEILPKPLAMLPVDRAPVPVILL